MPHFVVSAATPDAVIPAPASPGAVIAVASDSASPSDAASATTAASTPATTSPTPSPPASAPATHDAIATATAHAPATATAHATVAATGAGGGSGYWWLWLLLALAILTVAGMAVFRILYVRSRRGQWYGLAMNAYDRGTALVDGLKSGQTRSEFTMYANDYDGLLRRLAERAPSEDARWTVARVSAALEAVRQAGRHPGAEIVRTSVADLETTLQGLRDSALGSAADAQ